MSASPADEAGGLDRFLRAQAGVYETARSEIRRGRKESHWMWFIFPQVEGLGSSPTARRFAIRSRDEARRYLEHPVLGSRLIECAVTVLGLPAGSVTTVFGSPDDVKLRSSMTLFASVAHAGSPFARVLERHFPAGPDPATVRFLERDPS